MDRTRMAKPAIGGLLAGCVCALLLVVVGSVADVSRGPNLALPFLYLVAAWFVFTVATSRSLGVSHERLVGRAAVVGVVGSLILTAAYVFFGSGSLDLGFVVLFLWLPALVGAIGGLLMTMARVD